MRVLTREELAAVLKISVRTVDLMISGEEIPFMKLRGDLVRFYLPDVVRHLTATAVTRKRGRGASAIFANSREEAQEAQRR